jgi:hypothetical protein
LVPGASRVSAIDHFSGLVLLSACLFGRVLLRLKAIMVSLSSPAPEYESSVVLAIKGKIASAPPDRSIE